MFNLFWYYFGNNICQVVIPAKAGIKK